MVKVELSQYEAQRLLREWEERAEQLEGELSDLKGSIASVKAQLSGKIQPTPSAPTEPQKEVSATGKSRKGENLRILKNFFESLDEKGLTVSEAASLTGIGQSSVYVVLTKHKDTFTKGSDGLWRLKEKS